MREQNWSVAGPDDWAGAMVLSVGASSGFPDLEDHPDDRELLPYLRDMAIETDAPILLTKTGTVDTLEQIRGYTPKNNIHDRRRLQAAIDHYEPHIDFDKLLA